MKKRAFVKIKGIKPFLFHAFRESALDRSKTKKGATGNNPEEWKDTVIMDEERRLYIPPSYIFAAIREGGRYSKAGRGNIVKQVIASLEVSPAKIYFKGLILPPDNELNKVEADIIPVTNLDVYIDVRSVVNPMTKGRNMRYRVGLSPGWECEFFVTWDDSILSSAQMEKVTRDGGLMSGTGCGRAIGFGRFEVTEFTQQS